MFVKWKCQKRNRHFAFIEGLNKTTYCNNDNVGYIYTDIPVVKWTEDLFPAINKTTVTLGSWLL